MQIRRAATDITELYAPQFEQFGLELSGKGAVFTGEVANDRAHGRAWIMPLSPACIVMEHFITPTHDMYLTEYTPEPYACVSEVSAPTLTCMPEAGITPANLKPLHGPWPNNAVCSFIQDNCGEELSPLFAGELYHSRSVLFLPEYFDELEHRYPTEFAGIFEAFAEPWHEEATSAICHTLRRINEDRARTVGGHVYMQGIVETMVAELACSRAAHKQARQAADGYLKQGRRWNRRLTGLPGPAWGAAGAVLWVSTRWPRGSTQAAPNYAPPLRPKLASPWAPTFADAVWSEQRTFWPIARSQ